MNSNRTGFRRLLAGLVILCTAALTGCGPAALYRQGDAPAAAALTPAQALQQARESLPGHMGPLPVALAVVDTQRFLVAAREHKDWQTDTEQGVWLLQWRWDEPLPPLAIIEDRYGASPGYSIPCANDTRLRWPGDAAGLRQAERFVEAVAALQAHARSGALARAGAAAAADPAELYRAAGVSAQLGLYPEAVRYLEQYLAVAPDAPHAADARRSLSRWAAHAAGERLPQAIPVFRLTGNS